MFQRVWEGNNLRSCKKSNAKVGRPSCALFAMRTWRKGRWWWSCHVGMGFMSSASTNGWRSRRYARTASNKLGANDSEISNITDGCGCRCGESGSMSMWSIKLFFRVFLFLSRAPIPLLLPPSSPLILRFSPPRTSPRRPHFGFPLHHRNLLLHILLIIFPSPPFRPLPSFTWLRFLSLASMKSQNFLIDGLLGSNYKTLIVKSITFLPQEQSLRVLFIPDQHQEIVVHFLGSEHVNTLFLHVNFLISNYIWFWKPITSFQTIF